MVNCKLTFFLILGCFWNINSNLYADSNQTQQLDLMVFDKSKWEYPHDLCIIHAIPKCGTHYIERTIHLMTNQQIAVRNITTNNLQQACSNNQIIRIFSPYSTQSANILKFAEHKIISLVRDPRDALISHAFYMRSFADRPGDKTKRDFFNVGVDYDTLTFEEQIDSLITGGEYSQSYIQYYLDRLGWALSKHSLTIKYEDLVGVAGGGHDELKKDAVLKIIEYIHLDITDEKLQFVLDNMYVDFGEKTLDDKVFERSSIGNWRKFLSRKQIKLIKKKIGKEIIQLGYEKNNNW
jgi:hypothetical protein